MVHFKTAGWKMKTSDGENPRFPPPPTNTTLRVHRYVFWIKREYLSWRSRWILFCVHLYRECQLHAKCHELIGALACLPNAVWFPGYCTRLVDSLQQTVSVSTFSTLVGKFTQQPSCTISLWDIEIFLSESHLPVIFHDFIIARQHSDARYWYGISVCPSVCLSVCPRRSGIRRKRFNVLSLVFSPYGSPIILVLLASNFFTKFQWGHPCGV